MCNSLKKRAVSLLLTATTILGSAPAVLPKAAAAAADDVASKAVIYHLCARCSLPALVCTGDRGVKLYTGSKGFENIHRNVKISVYKNK